MFSRFNHREPVKAAKEAMERAGVSSWGRDVVEGKVEVLLASTFDSSSTRSVSAAMRAARSGVIRTVVEAAKGAANSKSLQENVVIAWDIAMGLLKVHKRRGRESKWGLTRKLLSRTSVMGTIGTSNGVTVSLGTMVKTARDMYAGIVGGFVTLSNVPNLVGHMTAMCSSATFLGAAKSGTMEKMPHFESLKAGAEIKDGDIILCVFATDGGAVSPFKCTLTSEKIGPVQVTRLNSKMLYFTALPAASEMPISLTKVGEATGASFRVVTTVGTQGTVTILGKQTDKTWPYHADFLSAKAIPADEVQRAALFVKFWEDEMAQRRNTLAAVDPNMALTMKEKFESHSLSWFVSSFLERIMQGKPGDAPFLGLNLEDWEVFAKECDKGSLVVAAALLGADDGLTTESVVIDPSTVRSICHAAFPGPDAVKAWRVWLAEKKKIIEKAKAEGKKIEIPDPSEVLDVAQTDLVNNTMQVVKGIRVHMTRGTTGTLKITLTAILSKVFAGAFLALEGVGGLKDLNITTLRTFSTTAGLVGDTGDGDFSESLAFLRMIGGEKTTETGDDATVIDDLIGEKTTEEPGAEGFTFNGV